MPYRLYQAIEGAIGLELDGRAFERCAVDLLRKAYYADLRGTPHERDAGMDGISGPDSDPEFILIATTSNDFARNLRPRVGGVFLPATVPSERARRHPHGFLVHGYARPGEPHTPEGWRLSDTVIETWDECLRHFPAYRDKPVIVSEWNCHTGGLTTADQYGPGGLAGDLTYTGQLYGSRAEAFCVFVGRSDNSWPDDCLLDSRGRCVRMRSDYDHLKAAGF